MGHHCLIPFHHHSLTFYHHSTTPFGLIFYIAWPYTQRLTTLVLCLFNANMSFKSREHIFASIERSRKYFWWKQLFILHSVFITFRFVIVMIMWNVKVINMYVARFHPVPNVALKQKRRKICQCQVRISIEHNNYFVLVIPIKLTN